MAIPLDHIAYYTMDNITGNTITDETGNHDASCSDFTLVPGVILQAIDNVTNIENSTLNPGSAFAISIHIQPDSDNLGGISSVNGWDAMLMHGANGGGVYCGTDIATRFTPTDLPAITVPGVAMHIVYMFDGTTGSFYKDGVLQATKAQTASSPWGGFSITGGRQLTDQLRIYPRILTQPEITSLSEEATRVISGLITESLGVTNWHVRANRLDNGALSNSVNTSDGTYLLEINGDRSHTITCIPEQGEKWLKDDPVIVDQLLFPPDPATTPYYYKVTVAGDTGSVEPTWTTTPGTTFSDGTATLECIERLVQPQIYSPVIPA